MIAPPATLAGAAGIEGFAALADDLASRVLALPNLTLLPPIRPAADPPSANLRIWEVLAAWRAAERELTGLPVDHPSWSRIHADLVGLRAAYARMFQERLQTSHPILREAGTTLTFWR
ncbi:MAG TPA: hypothetical protein VFY18_07970 [Candidatus Limnocylindrales bacterium]|nr:hypothetical protein [Candidatus Limnocylindrales bacterium]